MIKCFNLLHYWCWGLRHFFVTWRDMHSLYHWFWRPRHKHIHSGLVAMISCPSILLINPTLTIFRFHYDWVLSFSHYGRYFRQIKSICHMSIVVKVVYTVSFIVFQRLFISKILLNIH